MGIPDDMIPVIISNLFAIILIFICYFKPKAGNILWVIIFIAAGSYNIATAFKTPDIYVEAFGPTAVFSFNKNFIYGIFKSHTTFFVMLIASSQISAALFLLMKNKLYKFGIIAGIIFLIAVALLNTGSAFPSTILMAVSLAILYNKQPVST